MSDNKLGIVMTNALYFDSNLVPSGTMRKIRRKFREIDPKFNRNSKRGLSVENQSKYLNLFTRGSDGLFSVPRGCATVLTDILDRDSIEYEFIDERLVLDEIDIPNKLSDGFKLFPFQEKCSKLGSLLTQGVIKSPCGSGKTVTGIDLIRRIRQPTLVIVPDTELMYQWVERLVGVLGMDEDNIGLIGDGWDVVLDVTIGTVQSLYKRVDDTRFCNKFGMVMLDEAHMVGARTFREVMHSFPAKYRFGLTATPFRNDNLTDLIQYYCGKQFYEVTDEELSKYNLLIKPELIIRNTEFFINYDRRDDQMHNKMLKAMYNDKKRNTLICKDIIKEYKQGRLSLIVAKRADHCDILRDMLLKMEPKIRVADMSGNDYDVDSVERARKNKVDVVLSVNRAVQGLDIQNLENLFMVAPRKSLGEIEQIVGRIMRPSVCNGKYKTPKDKVARVYDYYDAKMEYGVKGSFNNRMSVYEEKCIVK